MKIIPSAQRVLVKQITLDQSKTESGLILPTTLDREQKTQGRIVALGSAMKNNSDRVKEGTILFFGTFAGEKLKVMENGKEEEYILLQNEEILGWME